MLFSGVAVADGLQGSVKWPLGLVLVWLRLLVLSHFASGRQNLPETFNSVCSSFFHNLFVFLCISWHCVGGGRGSSGPVKYLHNVLMRPVGEVRSIQREDSETQPRDCISIRIHRFEAE